MTGGRQVGESAGPSETVASEKTEEKADTSRNIQIFSPNLSADFARHTGAGSATKLKMTPIRIVLTNIFLLFTLSAYSENVVDSLERHSITKKALKPLGQRKHSLGIWPKVDSPRTLSS